MKYSKFLLYEKENPGYRVHWERREGGMLYSDYMPEEDEPPITSEEEAWSIAARVTRMIPNAVNIYIVYANNYTPVDNYYPRMIKPYPTRE